VDYLQVIAEKIPPTDTQEKIHPTPSPSFLNSHSSLSSIIMKHSFIRFPVIWRLSSSSSRLEKLARHSVCTFTSATTRRNLLHLQRPPSRSPFLSSQCGCSRPAAAIRSSSRSSSTTTSTPKAFDRHVKRLQRDNAARARKVWRQTAAATAAASKNKENDDDDDIIVDYEYFRQEMALRLVDRLDDIKRDEGFPLALDLGSGVGHLYHAISSDDAFEGAVGGIGGVRKMVLLDSSDGMLHVDDDDLPLEEGAKERCEAYKLHADEEDKLPFPDGTFDLVLSSQSLHWVNDLPNLFKEVFRVLKPDGCFMFSMIGGATLPELRIALTLAELEREGGVGTHVGPFVELSDVGSLMQNAGFALPTIDVDTVEISYPNGASLSDYFVVESVKNMCILYKCFLCSIAAVLMEHLQRMGEGNASLRRGHTGLDVFLAACCLYEEMYPLESEEGTDIKASAQVIFAIGWTPHESQPKPLKRGSATHRVGDIVSQHKADDI
jgi:NADH dehydrogenase [ubiquinone] 1 alpha subcomplex assembly factor 5